MDAYVDDFPDGHNPQKPWLGSGSYGKTYRKRHVVKDELFALKVINVASAAEKEVDKNQLLREVETLAALKHLNIVKYIDSFFHKHETELIIVMEYIDGGDLSNRIEDDTVNFDDILKWWNQLASALSYMHFGHSNSIIHRDIKPENIMLTADRNIKIVDFGLALFVKAVAKLTKLRGTTIYHSFEKAMEKMYDGKDDVWAAGCVIAELMTKCKLKKSICMYFDPDTNSRRLKLLANCDAQNSRYGKILRRMLEPEPKDRCSSRELVELLDSCANSTSDDVFSNLDKMVYILNESNLDFDKHFNTLTEINAMLFIEPETPEFIADGKFGEVCKRTYNGNAVAVKNLMLATVSSDLSNLLMKREAYFLELLRFPGVIHSFGVDNKELPTVVYMECGVGTLKDIIHKKIHGQNSFENKIKIIFQLCGTFALIHSQGYIHRDIQSSNILLMSDGNYKVTDFGLYRTNYFGSSDYTPRESHPYMAPELIKHKGQYDYSVATDVYAFAILMNEILTEIEPTVNIIKMKEANGPRPTLYTGLHDKILVPEITKRWSDNIDDRDSLQQLHDELDSKFSDIVM